MCFFIVLHGQCWRAQCGSQLLALKEPKENLCRKKWSITRGWPEGTNTRVLMRAWTCTLNALFAITYIRPTISCPKAHLQSFPEWSVTQGRDCSEGSHWDSCQLLSLPELVSTKPYAESLKQCIFLPTSEAFRKNKLLKVKPTNSE